MSPTHNQVEVDLDRKEELILAKQLRACRVQILPKVQLSSPIDTSRTSRSSLSPLPSPSSPRAHIMPPSSSEPKKQERVVMQELQTKMARAASLMSQLAPPSSSASVQITPGQGPAIVIQSPEDPRVTQDPPVSKLPFLADIKRLRQSPAASPSPAPGPVFQPKPESLAPAQSHNVNPHLGYLENRPKISEFPFLNDIKKLRKNPVQTTSISSPNPDTAPVLDYEPVKPLIPIDRREPDVVYSGQASKTVRFTATDPGTCIGSGNYRQTESEKLVPAERGAEDNQEDTENRMSKSQKVKRSSRVNFKIDEKTNVKKLADQMIPQMNSMQKNFLGLLFFNELSPHIVDDIVAQQLSMMPGSKLASILSSLEPQASLTSLNLMLNSINDEGRLSLLCENFSYLSSEERAGVLFSTADDVAEVCTTIADYGGKRFKKALISKLLENESDEFLADVTSGAGYHHNVQGKGGRQGRRGLEDSHGNVSSAEETYNSAEESQYDVTEDEEYPYQY